MINSQLDYLSRKNPKFQSLKKNMPDMKCWLIAYRACTTLASAILDSEVIIVKLPAARTSGRLWAALCSPKI
ncbi:MAG: hypothetical protein CMN25_16520 [Salinicola sp.]|nr:hypothetical protein [Salinicola sp.]|tara:strand:+ start:561 stop:776 length:216 start_codon:yes stop_codon:yes gene_type:complete